MIARATKTALAGIALAAVLLTSAVRADEPPAQFVGVWKILSFTQQHVGNPNELKPYGEHPRGYRVHTAGGRMFYMFFAEDRLVATGAFTDAERIAWSKTMASAGGSYKIDGDKVTFQPEMSAVEYLKPIINRFAVDGKMLTLTSDPVPDASGGGLVFRSTWERVE